MIIADFLPLCASLTAACYDSLSLVIDMFGMKNFPNDGGHAICCLLNLTDYVNTAMGQVDGEIGLLVAFHEGVQSFLLYEMRSTFI